MNPGGFYQSTIGKKVIASLTGIVLFGFVVLHMVGNLKAFWGVDPVSGQHHLDIYARYLREMGQELLGHSTLLWLTRIILLGSVLLHIITVIQLTIRNKAARPVGYQHGLVRKSAFASRVMLVGGVVLFFFIIYHILHLTTGTVHSGPFEHGKVFNNIYTAFQSLPIVLVYLISMMFLCFHLFHGVWSVFQTLGIDNASWNKTLLRFAAFSAIVTFLGFITVPLGIYFGAIQESGSSVSIVKNSSEQK